MTEPANTVRGRTSIVHDDLAFALVVSDALPGLDVVLRAMDPEFDMSCDDSELLIVASPVLREVHFKLAAQVRAEAPDSRGRVVLATAEQVTPALAARASAVGALTVATVGHGAHDLRSAITPFISSRRAMGLARTSGIRQTATPVGPEAAFALTSRRLSIPMLLLDASLTVLDINEAANELLGLSTTRVGQPLELVPPAERSRLKRALETPGLTASVHVSLASGNDTSMTLIASPVGDDACLLECVLVAGAGSRPFRDAVEARDRFVHVACHELRNPLTALLLRLHSLAEANPVDLPNEIKVCERYAQRIKRLADVLLDVGRLERGRFEIAPVETNVADVVAEVVDRFRREAADRGATIRCHLSPSRAFHDPLRIDQIVTNLLVNAIKHARHGDIDVSVKHGDGSIAIEVRDHGLGIPGGTSELFQEFSKIHGREGSGLGLWIVRQLVEACGGTVVATTPQGGGAAFTAILPECYAGASPSSAPPAMTTERRASRAR